MKTTKLSAKWLKIGALIPIGVLLIFAFSDKLLAFEVAGGSEKPTVELSENLSETKSPAMAAYLDKYGKFQVKAFENLMFKNRSTEEIQALFGEYLEFNVLYLDLTFEERRMVKRPDFPYVKLEKEGKQYYKRLNELNDEERKSIGC